MLSEYGRDALSRGRIALMAFMYKELKESYDTISHDRAREEALFLLLTLIKHELTSLQPLIEDGWKGDAPGSALLDSLQQLCSDIGKLGQKIPSSGVQPSRVQLLKIRESPPLLF